MRKLYNHNKGKIHPSPPPSATADHLSLLPIAIATLAAALAPEDKEVLAYLLSCSVTTTTTNNNNNTNNNFSGNRKPTSKIHGGDGGGGGGGSHIPQFNCDCFTCYTSYWVRWDASPNRQLIHEIIDAYEDGLIHNKKSGKNKKERRKNKVSSSSPNAPIIASEKVPHAPPQVEEKLINSDYDDDGDEEELMIGSSSEKGSVRKFVSFIGDRIWGVWGI
ncbi:uncharacterized protein LOC111902815 [Lactuca sativa]|uniref:Uncharacterized protein n=1 Tax=Lactuca sativa TaxID=4236 RepID=A0A9R1V1T2_LACSA|nr:uncharacterized protein LOC111902815 [Lactuca sativa]KAJ0198487.1 hypothetical protein LSAT_V11C700379400 [Lactuca sativa]